MPRPGDRLVQHVLSSGQVPCVAGERVQGGCSWGMDLKRALIPDHLATKARWQLLEPRACKWTTRAACGRGREVRRRGTRFARTWGGGPRPSADQP